ncbi:hypothetical protein [Gracilibacillus xinjiangensis]|uniref:Uncharacterized protein n=1 Tax=Gracilibacillus xinjiangensis TaxID=1193282 RepID=A0ABV8WVY6_9BACI
MTTPINWVVSFCSDITIDSDRGDKQQSSYTFLTITANGETINIW